MVEFLIDIEGKPPESADPIQTMYVDSRGQRSGQGEIHLYRGLSAWAAETRAAHRETAVEGGPDYPFELLLSPLRGRI